MTKENKLNTAESVLAHYGVKGMKWGVRKKRTASESHKAKIGSTRGKKAFELEDDELRKFLDRANMEQRYSSMRPGALTRGQKQVAAALAVGTTVNSVIAFSQSPAGRSLATRLKK